MTFDVDDEILQDFLVEGDEILEQLGEQLVDLEKSPQDYELLNAVFRGFHTIKGGAGFLNITALVEICHRAEDVFNTLRQGERQIDAKLMDAILSVVDIVNEMFESIRSGEIPKPADKSLHETLEAYTKPGEVGISEAEAVHDDEQSQKKQDQSTQEDSPGNDEITDEEFEALLDQLHGDGKPGEKTEHETAVSVPETAQKTAKKEDIINDESSALSDVITEDEFEALLDSLHGNGVPGGTEAVEQTAKTTSVAAKEKENISPVKQAARKESSQSQGEPTVRVDTKRLDDIMNLVGELVLVRNRLTTIEASQANDAMAQAVSNLDLVTSDLQTSVMKTRMQPIKKVFGRFPRVVRDLARNLNKEVSLELIGEETDLDKNLVEALADPLIHLVRNSVDHGIEMPDVREAAGKPSTGTIVLTAAQEGDHIMLTITDDGAGIDKEVLRRNAVEKGLLAEDVAARLNDHQCYDLIFMPGFSTKSEISDVSGRGVGMDVVKTRISQLNGSILIESKIGEGTKISVKLPLTLAIMPTLMILLGNQVFALPLVSVVEIFNMDLTKTNVIDGQRVVIIRNKALPIFDLGQWLVNGSERNGLNENGHIVVVNAGTQQIGFVVDQLIGQEEVVIKPLGKLLQGVKSLAGATITGNGRISLILDVPGLLATYANR